MSDKLFWTYLVKIWRDIYELAFWMVVSRLSLAQIWVAATSGICPPGAVWRLTWSWSVEYLGQVNGVWRNTWVWTGSSRKSPSAVESPEIDCSVNTCSVLTRCQQRSKSSCYRNSDIREWFSPILQPISRVRLDGEEPFHSYLVVEERER